jgi:hypothetical protein
MKQFIQILRGAGAVLFAAVLLAACVGPFDNTPVPQNSSAPGDSSAGQGSSDTGAVVIRANNGNGNGPARTVLPTAPDTFSRYELTLTKGQTTVTPPDTTGIAGGGVTVQLESGDWTATVKAYRQWTLDGGTPTEYLAAKGSATLTVAVGGTNTVLVTMAPVAIADAAGVKGIFSWNITLPEGLSSAELRLGDAAPVNLLTTASGSAEVAAGTYNLFITLKKGGLNAGLYELVYIYPGLESPAVFNFGAGGADELAFTDTVLLAGTVSASIPAGVTLPFTVTAYADAAYTNDITAPGSIASITAHGGTWLVKVPASYIGQNVYLKAIPAGANGHTPTPGTATVTALPANGKAGIALNIAVQVGITLDYLAEYLAALPAGSALSPTTVPLAASVIIDNEDPNENGVWATVNRVVKSAGKYVVLDLSACTAAGNTVKDADSLNSMCIIRSNQYIKGIVLPDTLTSIGGGAFNNCTYLTSVTIPDSVTSIGIEAFYHCDGLTSVTIPGSVTSIGNGAFYHCDGLTSVIIQSSAIGTATRNIGREAFYQCSGLASVTIQSSVTGAITIGESAFNHCTSLTSVTIGNGVTSIGNEAFTYTGLTGALIIPGSVTSIGDEAFYRCTGLTSVTIGNGVTSIGNYAFESCTGLTGALTIPGSVTSIGDEAFYRCTGLTSVTFGSGSNIASDKFGSDAFPEGSSGYGDNLRTLYQNYQTMGTQAGTYSRTSTSAETWTKGGPDNTAPVLSAGSVEYLITMDRTTATLKFTSNEAGDCYYLVQAAGRAAPLATTVTSSGVTATAATKGSSPATANQNSIPVIGLTMGAKYNAYIVVKDAAGNPSNMLTIPDVNPSLLQAATHPARAMTEPPEVLGSYSDGVSNFYLIDVGYIEKALISELGSIYFNGSEVGAPFAVSTANETTVTNSLTKTVSQSVETSHTDTYKWEIGAEGGVKINVPFGEVNFAIKTSFEHSWSDTTSTTNSKSISDTVETATAYSQTLTTGYTFRDCDVPGTYRWALYGVCDVYFIVETSPDNQDLRGWETVVCGRPGYVRHLEYSADGRFTNEQPANTIEFMEYFWEGLENPPNTSELKFDTDGGTAISPRNVSAGRSLSFAAAVEPTRDDYVFAGWDYKGHTVMPDDDLEIKARWLMVTQRIYFDVGNSLTVPTDGDQWYRTAYRRIELPFAELKAKDYTEVEFEWTTTWAEEDNAWDCTAHVVLDSADINQIHHAGESYFDEVVNPGIGWKPVTWTSSHNSIDTVIINPYVRCAYGYDERGWTLWVGSAFYKLSGTVSLIVTARKPE